MIVRIARVKVGNRQAPFAHMNPRQRPLAGVLCFGALVLWRGGKTSVRGPALQDGLPRVEPAVALQDAYDR